MNGKSKESEPLTQSPAMVPVETGPLPPVEAPREGGRPASRRRMVPRNRVWAARVVAMVADGIQLALLPLVMGGAASPVADAIDVVTAITLTWLVGWHWAFLPTFIAELVPFVDLVPSWTLATLIATRGHHPDTVHDAERDPRQP